MLQKSKLVAADWLRYDSTSRRVISASLEMLDRRPSAGDNNAIARSIVRLCRAARLTRDLRSRARIERKIRERTAAWTPNGFDWESFYPGTGNGVAAKSIIVKRPNGGEKGVIFSAFEGCWIQLFRHGDVAAIADDYDLVLSPTWSPVPDLAMQLAARMWPGRLYTILSNFDDEPEFARLADNLRTIPLLASCWVNPATFVVPEPAPPKQYDIFVLANFASYKRHFALFRAMQQMSPEVRAVLLGRGWEDRTRANLEQEARMFGVLDRITIMEGLPDDELVRVLHSSRVSLIMSMGEGACVAVTEALFADVPVGLIQTANIGSRAYINEHTGRFLRPGHVAEDLTRFIGEAGGIRPRSWMLKNAPSCHESSRIMNDAFKRDALASGRPWTADLVPMQWRPNAEYVERADAEAFRDLYTGFRAKYGVGIRMPPMRPDA